METLKHCLDPSSFTIENIELRFASRNTKWHRNAKCHMSIDCLCTSVNKRPPISISHSRQQIPRKTKCTKQFPIFLRRRISTRVPCVVCCCPAKTNFNVDCCYCCWRLRTLVASYLFIFVAIIHLFFFFPTINIYEKKTQKIRRRKNIRFDSQTIHYMLNRRLPVRDWRNVL